MEHTTRQRIETLQTAAKLLAQGDSQEWGDFLMQALDNPDRCAYCQLDLIQAIHSLLSHHSMDLIEHIHPKNSGDDDDDAISIH